MLAPLVVRDFVARGGLSVGLSLGLFVNGAFPITEKSLMPRSLTPIRVSIASVVLGAALFVGCAAQQQMPYHGFATQSALDAKDAYVAKESVGGKLDPKNLATEDQKYVHDDIYYDRMEEGYYQWGKALYSLGYRDVYYVRDMAPHAFRHELLDTYDHAIAQGFNDAESAAAVSK